jgi:transposase
MRVIGAVPRNHGPNVSCLAALTSTGICAPLVIEGAMNGRVFVPWIRDWLLPQLAPGMSIVLDNLSVHRNPAVEAAGCRLRYLPAYSPDLNPIELVFAKLKAHLRGVAARSYDPLIDAIGDGLDRVTATDIAGFYRHCGYELSPPSKQPS